MDLVLDVVTLDEVDPARFGQKRIDLVPAGVGLGPVVRFERNRLGRLLRGRHLLPQLAQLGVNLLLHLGHLRPQPSRHMLPGLTRQALL